MLKTSTKEGKENTRPNPIFLGLVPAFLFSSPALALGTGNSVDILDMGWQGILVPGGAAILGTKHLTAT